jgi:hypothetical protein
VQHRPERDVLQRKGIARKNVHVVSGDDCIADLEAEGLQDVALFAVDVGDERDASRAIRVVLDRRDFSRDVFLVPLEVDDPVQPLVPAAAPP